MIRLLIAGLPRSGTTALVRLLNAHTAVGLAMERYKFLARNSRLADWNPDYFEPGRLFRPDPGETNIVPADSNAWAGYYQRLRDRYRAGSLRLVGDKYPFYFQYAEGILDRVPGLKMVILMRDIHAVAASYQRRADDPQDRWPPRNGYRLAVRHYNEATARWAELAAGPHRERITFLSYERLFRGDRERLEGLLAWLGLAADPELDRTFARQPATWADRIAPEPLLTERAHSWIEKKIDRQAEARFFSALHGNPSGLACPARPSAGGVAGSPSA